MKILTTPLSVSVHYDTHNPVFGEGATIVSVDDEAAGPFIVLTQNPEEEGEPQKLKFDIEELEAVLAAAKALLKTYPKEKE